MINKEKMFAGVRACINPIGALCKNCPYWNDGDKQCEELRMDIVEAVHMAIRYEEKIRKDLDNWEGLQGGL